MTFEQIVLGILFCILLMVCLGCIGNMYRPVQRMNELDMLKYLHEYYKKRLPKSKEALMTVEALIRIHFK